MALSEAEWSVAMEPWARRIDLAPIQAMSIQLHYLSFHLRPISVLIPPQFQR